MILFTGIVLGLLASVGYFISGYSLLILGLLFLSLFFGGAYFYERGGQNESLLTKQDGYALLALLAIFAPLYLAYLHRIPWQINTDEVAIMAFMKRVTSEGRDPLGVSEWFGFPTLPFLLFGWAGELLGGITLAHIRLVHAVSGLSIIALSYLFFIQILPRTAAFCAATLLGANHAFLAISRMAMRENSGLLMEVAAFTLFFMGIKRGSTLLTFLGGAVTGLSFYMYFPGRVTLIIWFLFLAYAPLLLKDFTFKMSLHRGLISGFGFFIVATPVLLSTLTTIPSSLSYAGEQFLFLPQGQQLQQAWSSSSTPSEAIKKNILNGLETFNKPLHDHGYIYPNYGHGFVDPLTGLFIWLGLIVMIFKIRAGKAGPGDLLALVAFCFLYLSFSFLLTKAPQYTRLLIILPFVAYGVVEAIRVFAGCLEMIFAKLGLRATKYIGPIATGALVMIIMLWNLSIFSDFVKKGLAEGNDVGSTGRYVEARQIVPGYTFYLAASEEYPYYSWGEDWLGFFVAPGQHSKIFSPAVSPPAFGTPPFTLFMNKALWEKWELNLKIVYPNLKIHRIKTDGSLLAIEAL